MTTESLEDRVRAWLASHGAPYELRVGQHFRDAGWRVEHGAIYRDPNTGKSREIDILASVTHGQATPRGVVTVTLAIECKSSREKPWVVFTAEPPSALGTLPLSLAPGRLSRGALLFGLGDGPYPEPFGLPKRIGHGVVDAFSDTRGSNPTASYSAIQGAVSAAVSLNGKSEEFSMMMGEEHPTITIVVPVVITEADLFEYFLIENTPQLNPVGRHVVSAQHPTDADERVSCIILQTAALLEFAAVAQEGIVTLAKQVIPELSDLVRRRREYEGMVRRSAT